MKEFLLIKSSTGYRRLKPRVITRKKTGFHANVKGKEVLLKKKNNLFIIVDSKEEKIPKIVQCGVCGRVLTNDESVVQGIGPICINHA